MSDTPSKPFTVELFRGDQVSAYFKYVDIFHQGFKDIKLQYIPAKGRNIGIVFMEFDNEDDAILFKLTNGDLGQGDSNGFY